MFGSSSTTSSFGEPAPPLGVERAPGCAPPARTPMPDPPPLAGHGWGCLGITCEHSAAQKSPQPCQRAVEHRIAARSSSSLSRPGRPARRTSAASAAACLSNSAARRVARDGPSPAVAGRPGGGGGRPRRPPASAWSPAQLALQVAHRAAHARLDLSASAARSATEAWISASSGPARRRARQLGPPGVGDLVDLAPARGGVGDQPVRLHPGQPGIDRAGRRRVEAVEPVLQQTGSARSRASGRPRAASAGRAGAGRG